MTHICFFVSIGTRCVTTVEEAQASVEQRGVKEEYQTPQPVPNVLPTIS